MIEIIPAILTSKFEDLRKMMEAAEPAERVHIDIIDGEFADNKTIYPEEVADISTKLDIDYHLMVVEPTKWIDRCIKGQADRIIGHIEMMIDQMDFVDKVEEENLKAGLAIDLDTPVSELDEKVLNRLDVVLVMSVQAGFGGQEFDKATLEKIEDLSMMRKELDLSFAICDDGGITLENIDDELRVGVDEVSIGRRIFEGDLEENMRKFFEAAYKNG